MRELARQGSLEPNRFGKLPEKALLSLVFVPPKMH